MVDVEKSYDSGAGKTWVLRRISLDIREGQFITIMGPSGAGKSTLMGILGMLDGAWKGEYYLLENAVHKLDNRRRVEL
ncbi:MAG: ATP-binding cassette domain-containing protein, partial [Candidatus Acidiferrales bacterium]